MFVNSSRGQMHLRIVPTPTLRKVLFLRVMCPTLLPHITTVKADG
jgi:hypothetical protein